MTDCPFCGQPGQPAGVGMYGCDPCETLWSPVPKPVPERPSALKWANPVSGSCTFVPFIDHGAETVRTP